VHQKRLWSVALQHGIAASKMVSAAAFPEMSQASTAFQQIPLVFGLDPLHKPFSDG